MTQRKLVVISFVVLTSTFLLLSDAWAAVGRSPGSAAVSAAGAATYTLPIWVPPGPQGVQPSLALSYNSQTGNGMVGVGWTLTGGSLSIERCQQTVGQDGVAAGITLTASDRFCLNGNRLRTTGGSTYGAAGSTYQTEIADFSSITAVGAAGTGPQYFRVYAKNGLIYEYGNTTDSRVLVGTNTSVLRWMLNKVSDRNGNNYVVTYNNATGYAVPASISWTALSAGSSSYLYTAAFNYTTARTDTDSTLGYVAGQSVANRNLLSTIKIQSAASGTLTTVKQYKLTYAQGPSTKASVLQSVQECSDDGATICLSPTTMTYQSGQLGVNASAATYTIPSGASVAGGKHDFNGDGRSDLLVASGGIWYVAFGTASGFSTLYNTGISSAATVLIGHLTNSAGDQILSSTSGAAWMFTGWNSSTASFSNASTGIAFDASSSSVLADIDGNGFVDLVTLRTDHYIYTRLNSGGASAPSLSSTAAQAYFLNALYTNPSCPAPHLAVTGSTYNFGSSPTVDLNGDGKADILIFNWVQVTVGTKTTCNAGSQSILSTGSTFVAGVIYPFLQATAPQLRSFGKFNNDKCDDVLLYSTSGGAVVRFSNCSGTTDVPLTLPSGSGDSPLLLDWDGDGKLDLVYFTSPTLTVYLSTGSGYGPAIATNIAPGTGIFAFDQDGDGQDDLAITTINSTTFTYYLHSALASTVTNTAPDLLASIADGFGVSTSFTYATTGASSRYTPGSGTVSPLRDNSVPQSVVATATSSDGVGGTYVKSYQYVGARSDVSRGNQNVGFQQVVETDSRTGYATTTSYEQVFPVAGLVKQQDVVQSNGKSIVHSVLTNAAQTLDGTVNNQRYFPYLSSVTNSLNEVGGINDGLASASSVTSYSYAAGDVIYGNLTSVSTTTTDADVSSPYSGLSWSKSTAYLYSPDAGANWCLGIPTQTTVTGTSPAVLGLSASTVVWTSTHPVTQIDYVHCRATRTVVQPSTAYQVTEDFAFDNGAGGTAFGNITSDTITGVGMAARQTSYTWSDTTHTTGQFPLTVTNALSQAVQNSYDYSRGLQLSRTDPNGLQTSWSYDTFGRIQQETRPDGTYTTKTYAAPTGGLDPRVVWTSTETQYGADNGQIRTDLLYQDMLDRTINEFHAAPVTSGYIANIRAFDALGRRSWEGIPYQATAGTQYSPTYKTSFTYDLLGRMTQQSRPTSATNPAAAVTTIAYQGRYRIIWDPNSKQTTQLISVVGQLANTHDPMGYSVSMGYDGLGSVRAVSDSLGNSLFSANYAYGIAAFQTSVTDMDLGTWGRTYDALGEVTAYTDAKGQSFSATYDVLSRPLTRVEPDQTTTWTWGNSAAGHNIGQIYTVTSTSGYSEAYSFDGVGRLSNKTVTSDQSYALDYAYNTQGALDTLTFPQSTASTRVKLQYGYQAGILKSVTDLTTGSPGTVYWQATAIGPSGQVSGETLGNGILTSRSFDGVTGWLSSIHAGVGGGAGVQNQSFLYDSVGNLTQRLDGNAGLTENFYYDDLYRLSYSQLGGITNLSLTYDGMGNILTRSDVGGGATWVYDAAKKHAVRTAGSGNSYDYDTNGNVINRSGTTIGWSSYNYPTSATSSSSTIQFQYGPGRNYIYATYQTTLGSATVRYVDDLLEKVTQGSVVDWRHYIYVGARPVAVVSRQSTGTNTVHYVLTDNQGTTASFGNSSGSIELKESFSAFGNPRDAASWAGSMSVPDQVTQSGISLRGYTFHTMLAATGLVHMNGRVEDAVTGRFLSPDPAMSDPTYSQNYNRYSYVYNNPLSFTDPTGYSCSDVSAVVTIVPGCGNKNPLTPGNSPVIPGPPISPNNGGNGGPPGGSEGGGPGGGRQTPTPPLLEFVVEGTPPCPLTTPSSDGLDPRVQQLANALMNDLLQRGLNARVGLTYRTIAQQDQLYAQGRTTPGKVVTNSRGGDSLHNYRLAFDVQLFGQDRAYITKGSDPAYALAGQLGQGEGLEWGGNWKSFPDASHFQFTGGLTLATIKANVNAGLAALCNANSH